MTVLTGSPRGRIWTPKDALLGARWDQEWRFDLLTREDRFVAPLEGVSAASLSRSVHDTIRTGGSLDIAEPGRINWPAHHVGIKYVYRDDWGTEHEHPLGVFVPAKPGTDYDYDEGTTATVDLHDKMSLLQAVPPNVWTVDKGTSVVRAVTEVLSAVGQSTGRTWTNLHPNPQVTSLRGMHASSASGAPDLTYTGSAARWTCVSGAGDRGVNVGDENRDMTEGATYTLRVRARASRPMSVGIRIAGSMGAEPVDRADLQTEWTWHHFVNVAEDGTFRTGFFVDEWDPGDWIEIDRVMLIEGEYPANDPFFVGTQRIGERIINAPDDGGGELSREMGWEHDDSYLRIANDVLDAGGFFSLWVDASGVWRLEPYVEPARRGVAHTFRGGPEALFASRFSHEADWYASRNAVKIVGRSERDDDGNDLPPPFAVARNTDPDDPMSIPNRGEQWEVESDQDNTGQAALERLAARRLLELGAVTSTYQIEHEWLGMELNSAVRLVVEEHNIDALAVLQSDSWAWDAESDDGVGLVSATLREVRQ